MNDQPVRVPAHVQRYADVLGPEDTVKFLLAFGGTDLYIPNRPQPRSRLVEVIGRPKAEALGRALGGGHMRVPVAKAFIARHLKAKNMSTAEIARTLHVTDVTVRRYLGVLKSTRQLDFFE